MGRCCRRFLFFASLIIIIFVTYVYASLLLNDHHPSAADGTGRAALSPGRVKCIISFFYFFVTQ